MATSTINSIMDNQANYYRHNTGNLLTKTVAMSDVAGSGHAGTIAIATVTGTVTMKCFAVCTEAVTADGVATISVGTAISTAGLIANTTATNIIANEIWHDASPDASIELFTVATEKIVNANVIATVASANITDGTLKFIIIWRPLTPDGDVTV